MTTLWIAAGITALIVVFMMGRASVPRLSVAEIRNTLALEPTPRALARARTALADRERTIEVLNTGAIMIAGLTVVEVTPNQIPESPWLLAEPIVMPPDPQREAAMQRLADDYDELLEENQRLAELHASAERRRAKHWKALVNTRRRLAALRPLAEHLPELTTELEAEIEFKLGYRHYAKSFASKVNDVSTAVREVREGEMSWEEFDAGIDDILSRHRIDEMAHRG